jgi:hypothetical protein
MAAQAIQSWAPRGRTCPLGTSRGVDPRSDRACLRRLRFGARRGEFVSLVGTDPITVFVGLKHPSKRDGAQRPPVQRLDWSAREGRVVPPIATTGSDLEPMRPHGGSL